MKDIWKTVLQNTLVAVITALILAFPAGKVVDYLIHEMRPLLTRSGQDIQILELEAYINLGGDPHNSPPPEAPDNLHLVRPDVKKTERVVALPVLQGRRIVGITWTPRENISAVSSMDILKFEKFQNNEIRIEASLPERSSAAAWFHVTIIHEPAK